MDSAQIVLQAKSKFEQASARFNDEANKLRTGRAHPSMLDGITVKAYETDMPLLQVGSVTVPEHTLLQVTPFDPNNIEAISAAIRADESLGLNPSDDGRVVRVPVPPLTTERREQIVKNLKEKHEEAMIALRNARHEAQKAAKEQGMGEDDQKRVESQVDEAMQSTKDKIDEITKQKEDEIMTV